MKFAVSKKDLSDTLNIVVSATSKDKNNFILNSVYIKAEGSALELQANNNIVGIEAKIPCNSESGGKLLLEGKTFTDIIKKIDGEVVTFATENDSPIVKISDDKTSFTMMSLKAEDFPKIKMIESENSFKLKCSTLKTLINQTAFAAATKDDSRPIFQGCYFRVGKHYTDDHGTIVQMVATNTHRLAVKYDSDHLPQLAEEFSCIIPAKQLIDLEKYLDDSGEITVLPSKKNIGFAFDNFFFTFRLIDGEFPDHTRLTDKTTTSRLTIDSEVFLNAVQRVALVASRTDYSAIKFDIGDDFIEMSADCNDGLTAKEEVYADVKGAGVEVSFNVKYIIDVLKIFDGSKCVMEFDSGQSLSPVKFKFADNEDYTYICTPVRTK